MVGVFPSRAATRSIAVRRWRLAWVALSKLRISLSAIAASTKPMHFCSGVDNRTSPGPKILGGDVPTGDFLQVGVHVIRRDVLRVACVIDILQELLAW